MPPKFLLIVGSAMAYNVPHFAMFGAGKILARSATPAPNMGVATTGSGAAKCVLSDVNLAPS